MAQALAFGDAVRKVVLDEDLLVRIQETYDEALVPSGVGGRLRSPAPNLHQS
jgi:hypothetical protein